MKRILIITIIALFTLTSLYANTRLAVQEEALNLFDNHIPRSKTDRTDIMLEWSDDLQESNVIDQQLVMINVDLLLEKFFEVNLYTGDKFTVHKEDLSFNPSRQKYEFADYAASTLMSILVTEDGLVGDIHIGTRSYTIRPLANGLHAVVLSEGDLDITPAPRLEAVETSHKVSQVGHWNTADFYNLGKDGVGVSAWSANKLTVNFDRNLNGTFESTKVFNSSKSYSLGAPDGWVFGDWDNDGRDGIAFWWHVGSKTQMEFRSDSGGYIRAPLVSGTFDWYLGGNFRGPHGSCTPGESIAFVWDGPGNIAQIFETCDSSFGGDPTPSVWNDLGSYSWVSPNITYGVNRVFAGNMDNYGITEIAFQTGNGLNVQWWLNNNTSTSHQYITVCCFWYHWYFVGDWYGSPNGSEFPARINTDNNDFTFYKTKTSSFTVNY